MSTINYLTVRNTILPVVRAVTGNYSTLTGSTITGSAIATSTIATSAITVSTLNLASTMISLGQSTNQTYNNFSNGSYLTWTTAKSAMTTANKTVQSANGLYQLIVANATSGLFLSSDSGITWSTLTGGLPTLTGSAYWSDGAISANGQYITLSIYGGSLWMSADYGRTFALTNQPTPNIWLPLNGNTTDSMGSSTVTATGSPGYVTLNYPGYTAQAVNLANTAGGTATRYITGTWAGATNFTVSGWFNPQSLTGVYQVIFSTYSNYCAILINPSNQLIAIVPSGGGLNYVNVGVSSTLVINTWYYFSLSFQTNGTCSFYLNNTLLGSITNTQGVASLTTSVFELSGYEGSQAVAFNGFMDDFRITNSVSAYVPIPLLQPNIWLPFENSAGDLGSYSLPPSATPLIYLPFEGNVTDSMSFSTVTTPGTVPGYVPVNREGYTGQAVNLANTAGSNATRYVRGTWTGAANFTASFWMNPQSFAGVQLQVFAAYAGGMVVYINPSNQLAWYMPSGGAGTGVTMGTTSFALVTNTWYYVTIIFQTNGVCSFYVNNALIATYTNISGVGTLTTTQFSLGCNDNSIGSSFNGYIDDLRIYNSAIPYVPVSNTIVTGSLSYVPGVVGLNAVNLANTGGGAATNYIRGTCAPMGSDMTVSGWFNVQSFSANGFQIIFEMYNNAIEFYIDDANRRVNGRITLGLTSTDISAPISLNTWYHVCIIFKVNGACSFLLNGTVIQTVTNTAGYGTRASTSLFSFGTYATLSTTNAFNGYVDDFRIYNAAIPYHVLFPQNYRSLALSGTGQYALASAASGWVVGSSNSSQTWSKQAVCVGTQSDLIQPNLSGLGANTWIANGVTWTASASSTLVGGYDAYRAFNNDYTTRWVQNSSSYSTAGNSSGQTTTIQGTIGTVTGDWLQIQSSVPLVMSSYQFANGFVPTTMSRLPRTFHIVGSNDGETWQPIQSGTGATSPSTSNYTLINNTIIVNNTSTQTFGLSTLSTISYPTSTNAYIYFRLVCLSSYMSTMDHLDIGEWLVNFVRPLTSSRPPTHALSLNHTGQYQMVATGSAAGSIMPNQTGLAASTWTQSGVNWRASSSTFLAGYPFYNTFNNTSSSWLSDNVTQRYTNGSPNVNAASTTIQTIGATAGEWVQIQSSVPLVLTSFAFGIGVNAYPGTATPKIYYIVGSNDGSTWYPLQFGNFTISAFTGTSVFINMNTTGTQTLTSTMVGSVATTAYSFTTNAYTYFRLIGTSLMVYGGSSGTTYMEIGEWYMNFSNSVSYSTNYGSTWLNTSRTVSNESAALSSSGQYALSTNSVAPFARLTLDNTAVDAQGVLAPTTGAGTVTYSTSIKAVGSHSAFFDQTAGSTTPTMYLNYIVPTVLNTPSVLTMSCWMYMTALPASGISIPMSFSDTANTVGGVSFFVFTGGSHMSFAYTSTISGYAEINYGTPVLTNSWYHLVGVASAGVAQFYVNGTLIGSRTYSGLLCLTGGVNMSRFMVGAQYTSGTFAGAFKGYVDDVRLYTSALNADEISGLFKNPALTQTVAVSNSYLPITSYTEPTLPGITANVVDTAVSQTGQYMVAVTSSTTNNVYYSTDYGATFTALTVGSLAMVSCSISYDGSYLTVESATTVHTLNRNTRGFSVTVGNQAGLINQAQNAIAIGDKAGRTNQSANSIVLNATGNALDAVAPGFYVAPIATTTSSSATSFALLGYGTDNQVTQTNLTVLSNGFVGIGTNNPAALLEFGRGAGFDGSSGTNQIGFSWNGGGYRHWIISRHNSAISNTGNAIDFYLNNSVTANGSVGPTNGSILGMSVTAAGVGIGTTAPGATLELNSAILPLSTPNGPSNNGFGQLSFSHPTPPSLGGTTRGYLKMGYDSTSGQWGTCFLQGVVPNLQQVPIILNPIGGFVGIGTITPTSALEVSASNANATTTLTVSNAANSSTGFGARLLFDNASGQGLGSIAALRTNTSLDWKSYMAFSVSSGPPNSLFEAMRITQDGRLGIGITNPSATLQVNGSLAKSSGTFDIEHPLHIGTGKRLVHSFIEGPRCDLIYRGKTTLVDGSAVVDINKECTHSPECAMDEGTFEALCDNAECFLQNKTGFTRVIGVITGGILTITAESANATDTIVWMVIGERADPFIKQWDRTNQDGYLITQYTSENNIVEQPINNTTI